MQQLWSDDSKFYWILLSSPAGLVLDLPAMSLSVSDGMQARLRQLLALSDENMLQVRTMTTLIHEPLIN